MSEAGETRGGWLATFGKVAGLLFFVAILLAPNPDPGRLTPAAQHVAAVTALMATLWVTQAIPMAATALIPLVAFPLLGIATADAVSAAYMDSNIFLYLGGFVIALGIEKWGLHRRIALHIVRVLGAGPRQIVLGFMVATAFLSMWISNTATTLLMLPIGMALVTSLRDLSAGDGFDRDDPASAKFAVVLLLAIAYSASIGGFTTLVGTPTNVAFATIFGEQFPEAPPFSAGQWTVAVAPLGAAMLACAWLVLASRLPPLPGAGRLNRSFFTQRIRQLGRPSRAELLMLLIFSATALLWIFRVPLNFGEAPLLPGWGPAVERMLVGIGTEPETARKAVDDSTVAMGMALLMFVIPGRRDEFGRTEFLMDWTTAERLPWGILLLFGGGFALANAFEATQLSDWLGTWFAERVAGWPPWMLVAGVCFLMTFLTELTSNVATISTTLPVLAGMAVSAGIDPRLICIPAAISTSCAFMLPIATPPNAIIFGSGQVQMGQMVRYGLWLNLIGIVLVTAATFWLLVPQFGISLDSPPVWTGR